VIAATALENDLRLVTRNLADYTDIPELALYEPS
jgi:predicted nucleic acid-binding protein